MFISGATGDAGHWTSVTETLSNEFTVITYDRRGNSRSPRPPGWAVSPRAAVFHEPAYPSVSSNPDAVRAGRRALVEEGMAKGGSPAAMELFLRAVAGEDTFASLDPRLRERLLRNGDVYFDLEMETFLGYLPAPEQLAQVRLPCVVTAGAGNRDPAVGGHWRYEAAQWLAAQLGTTLIEMPDAHMPYLTRPEVFAAQLRPLLGKLT